jgi:hypothetical protein
MNGTRHFPFEVTLQTKTLEEFIQVVGNWSSRWDVGERAIYRGHTDFNWILIAKLFRDPNAKPENSQGDDSCQVEEQLLREHLGKSEAHQLERRLFRDFSRYVYAYRPDLVCTVAEEERSNTRSMQEWRQLALGQHYGCDLKHLAYLATKGYPSIFMNSVKAYEEVIDFIAAGTTPQNVIAFRPSEAAQERVTDLLSREKEGALSPEEKSELDHYLQLEHLMRLAKARARDFLSNE